MVNALMDQIRIIFRREPWWAEWWSGCAAILWGLIFGFLTFVHSPLADLPVTFSFPPFNDNEARTVFSVAFGLLQLTALGLNIRLFRWGMAAIGSWFWTFLVVNVLVSSPPIAPGVAVYAGYVAANLFSVVRLLKAHP